MKLHDLGLLLITAIHNNTQKNKDIFLTNVEKHKKNVVNTNDVILKQKEFYLVNYEQKRNENNTIYDEYIHNRLLIFNKWKNTNKIQDLQKLVNYQRPVLQDIDEIYTYNIITSKLK
jgi:response regulator RpfG family c-di-GMP phosphodiesterase